jgi:hypothetical protein
MPRRPPRPFTAPTLHGWAPDDQRPGAYACAVSETFHHGHEIRAEEIALHQKFVTLQNQVEAASEEGDERELRRLRPLVERAGKRWLDANKRVARGDF